MPGGAKGRDRSGREVGEGQGCGDEICAGVGRWCPLTTCASWLDGSQTSDGRRCTYDSRVMIIEIVIINDWLAVRFGEHDHSRLSGHFSVN